ncbi:carboxypeptidase-like regulatory domain-containing protein [Paractinoplanes toevensis]|uniref:Alpha-amylase n=1 Tax=Paractinoplanes toevensis TaxID=571911 RepID=A0A919T954_9ACTN|nr:carboxypeptidase-like regulatory domain-containing protein [Actinoplanes toevensis]GIM91388.1 hypothetical protein Ato02nite_031810 [Actinoplanes toevensis]
MSSFRLSRLGYAVLAGLVAAGALAAPASAAAGGTIQGDFTSSTNQPIAYASVNAYSPGGAWLAGGGTDELGHYVITDVPAGRVRIQFDDSGRQQWAPGKRTGAEATNYRITAGGTLTVDEQQLPTGRLGGHLDGPPTSVVVVGGVDQVSGYTDENGDWAIDVFPGTYRVSYRWDAVTQWAVQSATAAGAATYPVAAGQTVAVDDTRLPTGTFSGRLTEADGSPLAEAWLTLHHGDEELGYVLSGADGTYSFGEALARDGYTVSFEVDDTVQWIAGTLDPAKARRFTVVAGETTTADDVMLGPSAVHGRLADPDGTSKVGYEVEVLGSGVSYSATTGSDGRWSVPKVLPGDYRVSFRTPDWSRTQWAYGKNTQDEATVITVEPGQDAAVDDTWVPGATLVVNAVDAATGAPVSDFCVWVATPTDGSGCATGSSVTIGDLPAGSYTALVSPASTSYYLQSRNVPVTLAVGTTTTISVPVTKGGKVSVSATDRATGKAVRDVCPMLQVLGRGGLPNGYGDCTGAQGKVVTAALAPGTYELFAVAPSNAYGHQWVGTDGGTGDQQAAARITVTAGGTVTAPAVRLDKPGTISGVVTDPAGAALSGVYVGYSAWGDSGPSWGTRTGSNGAYLITGLGPYQWPLLFGNNEYPRQWSGHTGNRFEAEKVPVTAGTATTYNFTVRTSAALAGTVTVPAAPAAQWRIHAFNAVTGDVMGSFDSYAAGPGGTYRMPLTGAQTVNLNWSYDTDTVHGNGTYDTPVAVPAEDTASLDLTLN